MISRRVRCCFTLLAMLALPGFSSLGAAAVAAVPHARTGRAGVHPGAAALPESVLASVGSGRITLRDLRAAAARFGADPDSLTPQQAHEFLDVLIDQKAITTKTVRMPRQWTARDSSDYRALRDRLELDGALDSALVVERARRVAAGDTALDKMSLGMGARDAAVKAVRIDFNEPLVRRVAAAFDSLPRPDGSQSAMEQLRMAGMMPRVSPRDSGTVIATSGEDRWTVADLLTDWKRLNPLYRPRVTTPENVKDLIHNAYYERLLRRHAQAQHVLEQPKAAEMLRAKAEFLDLQAYVAHEVYAKIAMDSLTLKKRFDEDPRAYDVPANVVVLRFAFETVAEAVQFKLRLLRPTAVDTLLAEAKREKVDYFGTIAADQDSALVARCFAVGVGGLVGPDDTGAKGWRVLRVQTLSPSRPRTFAEAHDAVQHDWYDREGERLMRAMLDRLRKDEGVRLNTAAIARIGRHKRR